jgi:hypothetical protein
MSLGGAFKVAGPAEKLGDHGGQRVEGLAGRHPGGNPCTWGEAWQRRAPSLGQDAGESPLELGGELRLVGPVGLKAPVPLGPGHGPIVHLLAPVVVDLPGNDEGVIGPPQ